MVIIIKKIRELQKDKCYLLSLVFNFFMFIFMWEQVCIQIRKLGEISGNGKNVLNMKNMEGEEKVNLNYIWKF